jgi:signal transduction histidine kinase
MRLDVFQPRASGLSEVDRRLTRWGVPSSAFALGALTIAVKVSVSAPALSTSAPMVVITWLVTLMFIAIGWMLFRSDLPAINAWACLIVAAGTVPGDFNSSAFSRTYLALLGWTLEYSYLPAAAALVLRYPRLRLGRLERALVTALGITGVCLRVPAILFSGARPDGLHAPFPLARSYVPTLHDWLLLGGQRVGSALLLVVTAALLVLRIKRSTGARHAAMWSISAVAVAVSLFGAADQLTWVGGLSAESWIPAMGRNVCSALLPVAILADLLRRRTAAAMVGEKVVQSAMNDDLAGLQDALRATLADPTLLITMLTEESRVVGVDGRAAPSLDGFGTAVVGSRGRQLCMVSYNKSAIDDTGLLEAALQATRLGLENTRLNAEAIAYVAELRDSRARIIDAGTTARRRLERDLHDGAQQGFLSVAAQLAAARLVRDPSQMLAIVDEAAAQLQEALGELRQLARGIHPATLTQSGLASALEGLTEVSSIAVKLDLSPSVAGRRFHPSIEACAYFLVAEAVTNAVRHSGGSCVNVHIWNDAQALHVRVSDDGLGGIAVRPAGGLEGLRDRITALGGGLDVGVDDLNGGSAVRAWLPLQSLVVDPPRG